MKNKKMSSLLVVGGMLAGAVGSVGLVVYAQSAPATVPIVKQQVSGTSNIQDKSSVEVADQNENDDEQNDAAEQASLQAKAKITAEQAKIIALGKVPGTVTGIQLGDEDGAPVYEVTIGTQEVKVNAIDGSIVKIEKSDSENGTHESGNQNKNDEQEND